MKINFDGSWIPSYQRAGFGCVARDNLGRIMGVRAGPLKGIYYGLEAEAHALLQAMVLARDAAWDACIF